MKYFTNTVLQLIVFLSVTSLTAQENILLERDFWQKQPDLETVQTEVEKGNDPTQLNSNAFDPVVYALLENEKEEVIDYLLSFEGNKVEKRTHDGRTYLFWAAYGNDVKTMKKLLDKGSKLDVKDTHGNTPLTFAASTGQTNKEIYEIFEEYGTIISEDTNEDGANALLLIAPYLKDASELDYFLSKGIKLNSTDNAGNGIFNYVARNGNIKLLQQLIEKGVNYKQPNNEGGNAFLFAAQGSRGHSNSIEVYKFLKEHGLDAAAVTNTGSTALHRVAYSGDEEILNFFLKNGASAVQKDEEGNTPFLNAATRNSLENVQLLAKYVDEIDHTNNDGQTALMMAMRYNEPSVVNFLFEKGANTQLTDNSGNNLAYYLFISGKVSSDFNKKLAWLQEHDIRLNAAQMEGNNLYHIAAKANNLELLKELSGLDVDINTKNDDGLTPLHLAAMKTENDEILKYLISEGADISINTDFGESVYQLASENEILAKNKVELNFLK
ncbi:ankyrin repeat domain-containing protein [Gillisia sp. M10.2A]|uniref:Ankyrin repeat domain-containing protein n=1 Tax=Gillisia lutea TaxID=2909668 RepID=A0ABS9EBV4_9FLAO|nr:ankyrin repeat domain-containing protein [Gillisia lutea]MCF4100369.1 ankyrin repeat domain-containing protein [Gillisia lutea]